MNLNIGGAVAVPVNDRANYHLYIFSSVAL